MGCVQLCQPCLLIAFNINQSEIAKSMNQNWVAEDVWPARSVMHTVQWSPTVLLLLLKVPSEVVLN